MAQHAMSEPALTIVLLVAALLLGALAAALVLHLNHELMQERLASY